MSKSDRTTDEELRSLYDFSSLDKDHAEMSQERRTSLEIAEKNIRTCIQSIGFAGTRRPMTQNNIDFLKSLLRDSLERIARVKNE